MTVDLARLAAILTAPYTDHFGSLRCPFCAAPLRLAPGRRAARMYAAGLPERPCTCQARRAAA